MFESFKKGECVLITSHENPDPDAVGSLLCINLILKKIGVNTFLYLRDIPPGSLNFLPHFFEIKNEIPENSEFDTLIALDYSDYVRLKIPENISFKKMITIDHHLGNQKGEIKIVDIKASSTCEIIYWLMKKEDIEINKEMALCLLSGIVADTGGFSHVSTSSATLKAASDLLSKGVSLSKISEHILSTGPVFSKQSAEILGKVLLRLKVVPGCDLAYSWVSFEDFKNSSLQELKLNGISSIISKESKCLYALLLVEYEKGKVKGSLRSEPFKLVEKRKVDCIARELGGGGHPYAAGFKQDGTIDEVLEKVISMIR